MNISMEAISKEWHSEFAPAFSPEEMLKMGVFEGKYINMIKGIPGSWKSIPNVLGPKDKPDIALNYYKVKSRQPLSTWEQNGWIITDKGGWFHWYCLYYLGRRLGKEDDKQVGRWKSFVARHMGQVATSCDLKDESCHARQRQGLLQWGWDSTTKFTDEQREKNLERIAKLAGAKIHEVSTESLVPHSLRW
jgi:hypothetical protein